MNHSEFFKGDDDEQEALELISTIGCSMSFIGIFLTMLTYALLWKRLSPKSKVPSIVLMHLCVAIGMTDIFAIMAGPARNNGVSPGQTNNAAINILFPNSGGNHDMENSLKYTLLFKNFACWEFQI